MAEGLVTAPTRRDHDLSGQLRWPACKMALFTMGELCGRPQVIVTSGAVVGRVLQVADHPNAHSLWLADIDIGTSKLKIVFGGILKL